MNNYNKLKLAGLISLALGVSACGGSSSDSGPTPTGTTYTVAVSVPDALSPVPVVANHEQSIKEQILGFIMPGAYAVDGNDLSAENFAVSIVDPTGYIVEVIDIPANKISKNTDGTWEISIPGDPRFDRILVVDVSKPVEVFVDNLIPSGVVYAPMTSTTIDIDIQSTAAYQEFLLNLSATISNFADLTNISTEEVENIINIAQQVVLPSIIDGQTLEQYIQTAVTAVEAVIAEQIAIAETSTTTSGNLGTAAAAGGIYWFEDTVQVSFSAPDLEYGIITQGTAEQVYNFNGTDFIPSAADTAYSLTATGFQLVSDLGTVSAINADGSVNVSWEGDSNTTFTINATEPTDVSGMGMQAFFSSDEDTAAWAAVTPVASSFSASGALAYRSTLSVVNNYYEVGGEINCDPMTYTGQEYCNSLWIQDGTDQGIVPQTLPDMVSSAKGQLIFPIGMSALTTKTLVAELVDTGTSKIVYFFEIDYANPTAPLVELAETTTWETVTENTVQFNRFTTPDTLMQSWEMMGAQRQAFFEYAGFVRQADFLPAGTIYEGNFWLFNEAAAQDILASIDTSLLTAPSASNLTCDTGNGLPRSYADFEASVTACMTLTGGAINEADLVGLTLYTSNIFTLTFNADGSLVIADGDVIIPGVFNWIVNANGNVLVEELDAVGGSVITRVEYRLIESSFGIYSVKEFSESTGSGADADLSTGVEGQIWSQLWSLDPTAVGGSVGVTPPDTISLISPCFTGDTFPASYGQFETAVTACTTASARAITNAEISGSTLYSFSSESVTYNADGSASLFVGGVDTQEILSWSIVSGNLILVAYDTLGGSVVMRQETRLVEEDTGLFSIKTFRETLDFADTDLSTGTEGQIFSDVWSFSPLF